jgi:superfamily II DNA or RNA helicase
MSDFAVYEIQLQPDDKVRVRVHPEWGIGEVLRISQSLGVYQAKVLFRTPEGERVENLPLEWLEKARDLWERLAAGDFDSPEAYCLKQMAFDMAYANTGGELSASRVDLLPHQILLVHDLVAQSPRRVLIADEVGLGKTIETGMLIRELHTRGEAERILIVTPAGLIENWRRELEECFRLHFDVLGRDFQDHGSSSWERRSRVIASIDALKQPRRLQRLLAAPVWDLVIFDEAHHVSRTRSGKKTVTTQNYRLAEALKNHTRDLIFLSATPHQGNAYHFWSLIQLLNDQLFPAPESIVEQRGLLNRVMIRRTKREVTDSTGNPIFRRRLVTTERFALAPRERFFYDRLSEYLREGYNAAGMGQARTTSQQRAIGFVMATFQKIMSSSPRAIRQALRRRLLVLLCRKQLELEAKRKTGRVPAHAAEEIMRLQDEMVAVAKAILGTAAGDGEAEAYIGGIRRRLQKREEIGDVTQWALDGDEEADEGVFAEADIPDEIRKVRELIRLVPDGPDRRFETLMRAVADLSRQNPGERFVIFTQYRDTLEFIAEELARVYGVERIATLKGGPLDDKIAAMEAFWREGGAQFLISTSAGGEGINLQVGRILFNYDLPWNPMAVEQRIGRIHRYGQQETVQVYNLLAEDTVEERIYGLLEEKLAEIARSIGKIDEAGRPMEDFRSEILGLVGSRPDYQELFKRALVDRDYRRTEQEIAKMLHEANRAREALDSLTQDLSGFNLQNYRRIEGRHTLDELGRWVRAAILHLGGAAIPDGDFWTLIVPDALQRRYHLAPRYERVCFDRALCLRSRGADLGGIGHPVVDALLREFREQNFCGDVAALGKADAVYARYLVQYRDDDGRDLSRIVTLMAQSSEIHAVDHVDWTQTTGSETDGAQINLEIDALRARFEEVKNALIVNWVPDRQRRARVTSTLIGVHLGAAQ